MFCICFRKHSAWQQSCGQSKQLEIQYLETVYCKKWNASAQIADFGLSNYFQDSRLLYTFCGSPLYASPEIINGVPYRGPEVTIFDIKTVANNC